MPRKSEKQSDSRGATLVARFYQGRKEVRNAPRAGARDVGVLHGLSTSCTTEVDVPLENVLVQAEGFLVNSKRIFRYGNNVVMEVGSAEEGRLLPLATGHLIESSAASCLANLFICEFDVGRDKMIQFPPPAKFVATLLHREPTLAALPSIKIYALRPVFDTDFVLRGPGWHEAVGILVHGLGIELALPGDVDPDLPAIERLPEHLGRLLEDFCFKEDADVANAVAVFITGLLVTHFIINGKPVILLDGNQPGLGKTLLVRVIGIVLDGIDPQVIHYTSNDEELGKRILATLRGNPQSQLLIDNAKTKTETKISSPVIEANSVAAEISLRILGKSENYVRPNDVIWYLTMNHTKADPDLVSRSLPVRQQYEGMPEKREFGGRDPLSYAREHRQEILGELAGMVLRWDQAGRPQGHQDHRLVAWAKTIGGIMEANGLPEFLTNLASAAAEFNTALDALAALAEVAIVSKSEAVTFLNQEDKSHAHQA